jgi:hypothetical protein
MQLQQRIVHMITALKRTWSIDIVIVMDGITPLLVTEWQHTVLEKAQEVWQLLADTQASGSNSQLFMALLEHYGPRLYLQEIMNACNQTSTEYFIAPYQATPQLAYFFA